MRWRGRPARRVRRPVLTVEVDGLAPQHTRQDADVFLGAPARMVVGESEHTPHQRLVRRADAEREPRSTHRVDDRRRTVRLQEGMARIRLQDSGAQLDP